MLRMRFQQMLVRLRSSLVRRLASRFKLVPTYIDSQTVEFIYKGDTVLYLWTWARDKELKSEPWLSLTFQEYYPSLAALDKEWNNFLEVTSMPSFRRDID